MRDAGFAEGRDAGDTIFYSFTLGLLLVLCDCSVLKRGVTFVRSLSSFSCDTAASQRMRHTRYCIEFRRGSLRRVL